MRKYGKIYFSCFLTFLFVLIILSVVILPMAVSAEDGELEDEGGFHVSLLYLAAFLGLLAALSGMRNSRIKSIANLFPNTVTKNVPRIFHRWVSILYYAVFFGTFIIWSITFYGNRGEIYFTLHGQIGLLSFLLAIIGIVTGLIMWKRPAKLWRLHWVFNAASYVLLLVTILLGQALGD